MYIVVRTPTACDSTRTAHTQSMYICIDIHRIYISIYMYICIDIHCYTHTNKMRQHIHIICTQYVCIYTQSMFTQGMNRYTLLYAHQQHATIHWLHSHKTRTGVYTTVYTSILLDVHQLYVTKHWQHSHKVCIHVYTMTCIHNVCIDMYCCTHTKYIRQLIDCIHTKYICLYLYTQSMYGYILLHAQQKHTATHWLQSHKVCRYVYTKYV